MIGNTLYIFQMYVSGVDVCAFTAEVIGNEVSADSRDDDDQSVQFSSIRSIFHNVDFDVHWLVMKSFPGWKV